MNGKLTARLLTPDEIAGILETKLKWILSACNPEKIILFGSAAVGHMTTASDVDLIIVFESAEALMAAKPLLFRSRSADDWPHDLLLHDVDSFNASVKKGGGACWVASQDGKTLYNRDST